MSQSRKRRKLSNGTPEEVSGEKASENGPDSPKGSKEQRSSLFVRSLPASVTSERLAEHFSQNHPLKHATVVVDPKTKISRGFGFVTFTEAEDARIAAEELNNSVIDGRKIKVEIAEPRHREVAGEGERTRTNLKAVQLKAEREKQRAETQPPRLIVRNLPWSIKESDDLALLFRSYGKIKHAVVPKRNAKEQAGFGFVVIRGKKNAEKAIEGVNGKVVDGRTLAVDWAVDKQTWESFQQSQGPTEALSSPIPEQADAIDNGNTELDENVNPEEVADDGGPSEEQDTASEVEEESESDVDGPVIEEEPASEAPTQERSNDTTVFVRNVPFTTDDEILKSHFRTFGPVRYARVVYDPETERSRGTAFVCFFNESDARDCVRNGPKPDAPSDKSSNPSSNRRTDATTTPSVLQNLTLDPSGRYTLDGRVLHVSRALSKAAATQCAEESSSKRRAAHDRDKRRLYLLSEGTMAPGSPLYEKLGKPELDIREASAKQRQKLIKSNPNLGLSLTRLSVRNLPRGVGSKELKALAREAVVGFATDVKNGSRQPLSAEERGRGGEDMKVAEKRRKEKGVGIVRQAKIVFEGREGEKVKEAPGAGRSRGYGFVEYSSHRWALMGLRWLNGHLVKSGVGERGKRLIVEFAIENAQVVRRRGERERRERTGGAGAGAGSAKMEAQRGDSVKTGQGTKRKRDGGGAGQTADEDETQDPRSAEEKNKIAKRNRIIAKKRHMRKARGGGGAR